jgi:hypothetical protein
VANGRFIAGDWGSSCIRLHLCKGRRVCSRPAIRLSPPGVQMALVDARLAFEHAVFSARGLLVTGALSPLYAAVFDQLGDCACDGRCPCRPPGWTRCASGACATRAGVTAGVMPRAKVYWAILALLFSSTALNYVDRQTLSIPQTTIHTRGGKGVFTFVSSINARMGASDPATSHAANVRRHPLGRLGTPEEVADLVLFPSDAAAWTTGTVVGIDGGAGITRR